jgi:hypothetical protein
MTRQTVRTLLLVAATLALPLACGLRIDEGDPDHYSQLPTIGPPGAGYEAPAVGLAGQAAGGSSSAGPAFLGAAGTYGIAGSGSYAGSGGAAGVGGSFSEPEAVVDAGGPSDAGLVDGGSSCRDGCPSQPALCLSNDECGDGLCVNNRCRSFCAADVDCPVGEGCVLGLCRADTADFECLSAEDCPASDDCVGGSCLRRCLSAEHCEGSDDGLVCSLGGYCGP